LALAWRWYRNPLDKKQQTYFFSGIAIATLIALTMTAGWEHVDWFGNPFKGLSTLFSGGVTDNEISAFRWITGVLLFVALLLVIWKQAKALLADMLGLTLLLSAIIGLLTGDEIFGFVSLVICLYWGVPLLLPEPAPQSGFWKQRGLVLALTFILSTAFMVFDKSRYQTLLVNELSPRDSLIKTLAEDSGLFLIDDSNTSGTPKKFVRIASQWPGLTMLACRCDAHPLPPEAKDSDALLAMLKTINYLIFDPRDPKNISLAHNLATIDATKVETIILQQGGVIVQVKTTPFASAPVAPRPEMPVPEKQDD
jgi:hypothetical protein